uniref:Salivary secreted peptide n=1 Tax=Anopheles minimus TaxID=112268 RepID=A0A182WJT4_9DIPT
MKFAFAFVLIALFAVISITQAMPQPEEATPAPSDDTQTTGEAQNNDTDFIEMGGRRFPWKELIKGVVTIIKELLDDK